MAASLALSSAEPAVRPLTQWPHLSRLGGALHVNPTWRNHDEVCLETHSAHSFCGNLAVGGRYANVGPSIRKRQTSC